MSEEKKKAFSFGMKDGKLSFGIDPNKDGENVVSGKLYLSEAFAEAFMKGKKVEGAKVVDVSFKNAKLTLVLDTDQDGEKLLELEIDLAEAFDEVRDAMSKQDAAVHAMASGADDAEEKLDEAVEAAEELFEDKDDESAQAE